MNYELRPIVSLPNAIQKWLIHAGVSEETNISQVLMEQDVWLKLKPDQKQWKQARATQFTSVDPPEFNWTMKLKVAPFLHIKALDQFSNGKGQMTISFMSIIPLRGIKNNAKVDQASLQRFLAETVWYPSAARLPFISWESLDDHSAKATMSYGGTTGSGTFHFDQHGGFLQFRAWRYKESTPEAPLLEWIVTNERSEKRDGYTIPVKLSAAWKQDATKWTWLKVAVKEVKYRS